MIRVNQIKLGINEDPHKLRSKIAKLLKLNNNEWKYTIVKRSLDARKKDNLMYIYSVDISIEGIDENAFVKKLNNKDIMLTNAEQYNFPKCIYNKDKKIIIVGSGPAGLFCGLFLARAGYKPVIFERGEAVEKRSQIVQDFWNDNKLNLSSNVQFGEGGAGTFSDGKLNTGIKDRTGRIRKVLNTFVEFGASPDILWLNKPHIGTDVLKNIVASMRAEIIRLGGEVHFNSCVTDLYFQDNKICGVRINDEEDYAADKVVLAIGHSARDTFIMLGEKNIALEAKAFAVGMRVEHPQSLIDAYTYGLSNREALPAADYKLTAHSRYNRGVYSFCMCPGGYVVNASSEENMLCVNGMSYSDRAAHNANSAIVVTVEPNDFGNDLFSGMDFQRKLERAAYIAGKGLIPTQLNEDFAHKRISKGYGSFEPCTKGSCNFANLYDIFPEFISESVIDGMKSFDKIINGFNSPDAIFHGVESRTSSPLRILRDDSLQSITHKGIYPCGEGAGYAGGITSAAVDGIKIYEAIVSSDI